MARKTKESMFDNVNTGKVYEQLQKAQKTTGKHIEAGAEEKAERAASMRTQGKKGCKAVRINMAFTPDNHDFIKTMARVTGKNMTEFTNIVIERYRTEHPEKYEDAKRMLNEL